MDVIFYHYDDESSDNQQSINSILPNIKYIIYSQANISAIQVAVMNSGGWFLLLILVFLILIAMCRKHCCLRDNQQRLSYNDILENIQMQNPFLVPNNDGAASSNAEDQKTMGVTEEELNSVSVIEIYHKKRSKYSFNLKLKRKKDTTHKYKACCICLYDYRNGDKLRKLNCNHYFHQQCIDIWFKKNIQCPLCKQSVINAQILSKRSATTNSDISTSTLSTSGSSQSTQSGSTQSTESNHSSSTEITEEEDDDDELEEKANPTYSLSDSHCIYNAAKNIHNKRSTADDMYIMRHRHNSGHTHSYSHSFGTSHSSHSSEIITNNNNNNNSHQHLVTIMTNTTTTNSNELSISSSPQHTYSSNTNNNINNNNDLFEPTSTEDNKSFVPLTPNINLYFENTFLSHSPSNHKKE